MKSKGQYEHIDALIGKLLVIDPDMSLREMQQHLEKNGLHIGDPFGFLAVRREKVRRKLIARVNRSTKILNAAEYNGRVNHALETLLKLTTAADTPPGVKARAAEAITNISHKRLMTFTLLGIHMSDIQQSGAQLGEKEFPVETFDPIMTALGNNMFRPQTATFKYLPETIDMPKINKPMPDANAKPTDEPKYATLIPVKDDRSFAVPPR